MGTEDLELTAVTGGADLAPLGPCALEAVSFAAVPPIAAPSRPRRSCGAWRRTKPPPAGGPAGRQLWGRVDGPQAASGWQWLLVSLRVAAEDRRGGASLSLPSQTSDPTRPTPAPHIGFDKRIQQQTFDYDWLGNNAQTGDDADGFYDRSLGTITNDTANKKPYQLVGATNVETATAEERTGHLSAKYDDAGNLIRLIVNRDQTHCLPASANCSQDYAYQWDEVGRLVDARRWDFAPSAEPDHTLQSILPTATPDAHLEHAYDSSDQRVRKTAIVGGDERHTLYPMASLELRRAEYTAGAYSRTKTTETPYLFGHGVRLARLAYDESVPQSSASNLHTFIELGDHLGSTGIAIDRGTGELAERVTYQANGTTESDYRPARWDALREDYRFTGKEEDVEVGLAYFGKRFLSPFLGRWTSADALALHAHSEADQNLYAYVRGRLLAGVDPVGLDDVMVVVSRGNTARDTRTEQEIRSAGFAQYQWQHFRLVTGVLNAQTRQIEETFASPARHVTAVAASAGLAGMKAALQSAAKEARPGGKVILSVGHGASDEQSQSETFADFAPNRGLRITKSDLIQMDRDGKKDPKTGITSTASDEIRVKRDALAEMGSILRGAGVKELELLTCRVGADKEFVQALANRLGVTVSAHTPWVAFGKEKEAGQPWYYTVSHEQPKGVTVPGTTSGLQTPPAEVRADPEKTNEVK